LGEITMPDKRAFVAKQEITIIAGRKCAVLILARKCHFLRIPPANAAVYRQRGHFHRLDGNLVLLGMNDLEGGWKGNQRRHSDIGERGFPFPTPGYAFHMQMSAEMDLEPRLNQRIL